MEAEWIPPNMTKGQKPGTSGLRKRCVAGSGVAVVRAFTDTLELRGAPRMTARLQSQGIPARGEPPSYSVDHNS